MPAASGRVQGDRWGRVGVEVAGSVCGAPGSSFDETAAVPIEPFRPRFAGDSGADRVGDGVSLSMSENARAWQGFTYAENDVGVVARRWWASNDYHAVQVA